MIIPVTYVELIGYVMIPLFVCLMVFGVFMIFTAHRHKSEMEIEKYNYRVDFWSSVIAIIFCAIFLGVALGFSTNFIERIYLNDFASRFPVLLVILYIFPVIPLVALLAFVIHFLRLVKRKKTTV